MKITETAKVNLELTPLRSYVCVAALLKEKKGAPKTENQPTLQYGYSIASVYLQYG